QRPVQTDEAGSCHLGKELVQQRDEAIVVFDVRDVARVLQNLEPPAQQLRQLLAGLDRNRVVSAVKNQRWDPEGGDRPGQIVRAEALPHRILGPSSNAKRSKVVRPGRITEVAGNRELEHSLAVRTWVALSQS